MKKAVFLAENGKEIKIVFYPISAIDLTNIRSLAGRYFVPVKKAWYAPMHTQNIEKLKSWGFEIDGKILEKLNKKLTVSIPQLKNGLYPFQKEGVMWIEEKNGRALLADEMGLGKTIQALSWIDIHPEKRPVVIVCPAFLKLNWKQEADRWLSEKMIQVLNGTTPDFDKRNQVFIINYDIIFYWTETIINDIRPEILVLDEVHYIKSSSAKRTKTIKMIGKSIKHIIALSGTPVLNRPIELYNSVKLIAPNLFPNRWDYINRYCNPRYNGFGWNYNGASNLMELHEILSETIMIRRLKRDVLSQLPDKRYSYIPMQLNQRGKEEYASAERDFIRYIMKTKGNDAARRASRAESFTKINLLKQIVAKNKLPSVVEWINDFLEESDGKLVVFAHHREIIDALFKQYFQIAVKYDGTSSIIEKESAKNSFQNNKKIRLFIGSMKVAGTGLTLTAASDVAFIELPWTPGELNQCIDRCHRIGQEKQVNVYYLLASETIEEFIVKKIDAKKVITSAIMDGESNVEELSLISEIINEYEKRL